MAKNNGRDRLILCRYQAQTAVYFNKMALGKSIAFRVFEQDVAAIEAVAHRAGFPTVAEWMRAYVYQAIGLQAPVRTDIHSIPYMRLKALKGVGNTDSAQYLEAQNLNKRFDEVCRK